MKADRLLAILLSLTLMLGLLPATVFADETQTIDSVTVTIPEVKELDVIGYDIHPDVTIPSDANYTVQSKDWVEDTDGTLYPYSKYAGPGQTLYAKVVLKGADPYRFNETAEISFPGGSIESRQLDTGNNTLTLILSMVTTALEKETIPEVSIGVTAPAEGETAGNCSYSRCGLVSIPSGQGYVFPQEYSSGALGWYDGDRRMSDNEAFVKGRTYKLYVRLRTDDKTKILSEEGTTVTVTGEGTLLSKSFGTQEIWTTLSVGIEVELTGAHNVSVVNCTADKTRAAADEEITLTAAPPEAAYPGAEFAVAGWCINGVWDDSTETTRTVTMPDADLSVMVRYNVTSDISVDKSAVTVTRELTINKDGIGEFSGEVYSKTQATTFDKTGVTDEPAATMRNEAAAARDAKIAEVIGDTEYEFEWSTNGTETVADHGEKPEPVVSFLGPDGEALQETDDYVIKLTQTSGDYGKEMKYTVTESIACSTSQEHVHTWSSWTPVEGQDQHKRVCSGCNEAEVEAHSWDSGVITVAPTETTAGERTYTCTACGATKVESIPRIPVNYVKITLDAGEGHDTVAGKIGEQINKTADADHKAEVNGTAVSLYVDERLTVKEAEDELDKIIEAAEIGIDNGQRWAGRVGLKPAGEYADFDEYWASERAEDSENGNKVIAQDTKFFVHWNDPVSSVDLKVKAPVAGSKVRLNDENVPDKRPEVTIIGENAAYQKLALSIWKEPGQETGPFIGTFVNGTEYAASIWILPEYGYYLAPDFKVTVNGKELAELYVNYQDTFVSLESIHKAYKLNNTLSAKGKTVKAKARKLKKRSVKVSRKKAITVKKAKGKVTYRKFKVLKGKKKVSKKIAKKFLVNKKTGKITLKKGIKKGTYKFKIKVKAAGTKMYKAKTKTVTVKVRVK